MKVYNYSAFSGEFTGVNTADESPLEPGVFLIPANATTVSPPDPQEGKTINFQNGGWVLVDIPITETETEPEPEVPVFTYAQNRAMAYPPISQYLDGVVKSDQSQIDKYIADCLAVKAKYPKEIT